MAIKRLAELFDIIIAYERLKLKTFEFHTPHAPTIGEQYEKIIMKGLNSLLPTDADIRVVSGFICNDDRSVSRQIDCMIVMGEGREDPCIKGVFYYHIHNVLAVIEVKKNLFAREIDGAFNNLYSFISPEFDKRYPDFTSKQIEGFFRSFARISGKYMHSYKEAENSDDILFKQVFLGFRNDYTRPLRIVFGYDGISTESSLRETFKQFIAGHLGEKGFDPFSYPDLIICGNHCLLKLNDEPYPAHLTSEEYYFYASSSNYCIVILVELILGRISRYYNIDYTDDNQIEPINMFLTASIAEKDGVKGWKINCIDYSSTTQNVHAKWKPLAVSTEQFAVFNLLCKEPLDINNAILQGYLKANKDFLKQMLDTKLVAIEGTRIRLISTHLLCAITKDGLFVGDDAWGYFSRWICEKTQESSKKS